MTAAIDGLGPHDEVNAMKAADVVVTFAGEGWTVDDGATPNGATLRNAKAMLVLVLVREAGQWLAMLDAGTGARKLLASRSAIYLPSAIGQAVNAHAAHVAKLYGLNARGILLKNRKQVHREDAALFMLIGALNLAFGAKAQTRTSIVETHAILG